MRTLQILSSLFLVVTSVGCTAQNLCAREMECREENDEGVSDDDAAVCTAEVNKRIDSLRANQEPECQALADAEIAVANCRSGLSCDDYRELDLGGECDEQLDVLEDAREDVDGDECLAQED